MRIVLNKMSHRVKCFLDNGSDITNDLWISKIEIKAAAGEIVTAVLTVYPSEVVAEIDDDHVIYKKHPDWEIFKTIHGHYGKRVFPTQMVLGDDFGRGI